MKSSLAEWARYAKNGRILITPVLVADLLAEGEPMPLYVHVVDHPDGRVLVDTGMTELHPFAAPLEPRLRPLNEQDFDLASIDIVVNTHPSCSSGSSPVPLKSMRSRHRRQRRPQPLPDLGGVTASRALDRPRDADRERAHRRARKDARPGCAGRGDLGAHPGQPAGDRHLEADAGTAGRRRVRRRSQ